MGDRKAAEPRRRQRDPEPKTSEAIQPPARELRDALDEGLRFVTDSLSHPIAVVQDGVPVYLNSKAKDLLGSRLGEVASRPLAEFVHPDDREMVLQQHQQSLPGEEAAFPCFFRIMDQAGGARWMEAKASPIAWWGRPASLLLLTDITERKQTEERIHAFLTQLRSLVSGLALAEVRDRKRLATELDNLVGQPLAVLKLKLGALRRTRSHRDIDRELDAIVQLADRMIGDTRSLMFDLSPPVLYELGLEAGLEWLADQVREQHGLHCVFRNDGQPKPLGHDASGLVFRSVRELLTNIVRHAQAQNATVSIARHNDHIRITVEYGSAGFDPSEADRTALDFALFGIAESLTGLGGRLDIEAKPGQGIQATIAVPLPPMADDTAAR